MSSTQLFDQVTIAHSSHSSIEFDCRSCGACCAAEHLSTVEVTNLDTTPREYTALLPGRWRNDITGQVQEGFRLMRRIDGRCSALIGQVGQQVSCSVYDDRPAICRRFEPGGEKCLSAQALQDRENERTGLHVGGIYER